MKTRSIPGGIGRCALLPAPPGPPATDCHASGMKRATNAPGNAAGPSVPRGGARRPRRAVCASRRGGAGFERSFREGVAKNVSFSSKAIRPSPGLRRPENLTTVATQPLGKSPRSEWVRAFFPQAAAHRDGSPYLRATNGPGASTRPPTSAVGRGVPAEPSARVAAAGSTSEPSSRQPRRATRSGSLETSETNVPPTPASPSPPARGRRSRPRSLHRRAGEPPSTPVGKFGIFRYVLRLPIFP